jgi:hypothetical protein
LRRRNAWPAAVLTLTAAICLAVAVTAGTAASSALHRKPTAAEKAAAARSAMIARWRSWPAGRIFPASLGYQTSLLTSETADRTGISRQDSCTAALAASLAGLSAREHCTGGLRASYADELQGTVYTIGLFVFPNTRQAAVFLTGLAATRFPLRALAVPGTASASFDDAARQTSRARQAGPFVIVTTAGYADGRPAASSGETRNSVFAPASQLSSEVIGPLTVLVTVNCASREFSC